MLPPDFITRLCELSMYLISSPSLFAVVVRITQRKCCLTYLIIVWNCDIVISWGTRNLDLSRWGKCVSLENLCTIIWKEKEVVEKMVIINVRDVKNKFKKGSKTYFPMELSKHVILIKLNYCVAIYVTYKRKCSGWLIDSLTDWFFNA